MGIDFVLIWVDGNDSEWQAERKKYLPEKNTDTREIRYRNWNNLKYWFRGVEKYAPWVNKVHFVTCGHLPNFLNCDNPKLNIVNHKDYMPKEYLPTFNSHTIELNLHRIEGLSEKFVYFNDDMFLTKNVKQTDFFINGLPCDSAILNPIIPEQEDCVFEHILINNIGILNQDFSKKEVIKKNWKKWYNLKYGKELIRTILLSTWPNFTGIKNNHLPSSFLKSSYIEIWKNHKEKLHQTSLNKFRSSDDVNQYVIKNLQLAKGEFYPRKYNIGKWFDIFDNDNSELFNSIKTNKYKMICINDDKDVKNFEKLKQELNQAFETILPEKSSFEK